MILRDKHIDIFYRASILVVVFVLFCSPILHTFKLLRYGNFVGALFFYVTFPLMSILFFLSYVVGRKFVVSRFDLLASCLSFLFCWSLLITLYNGGQLDDVFGNIFRVVLALFCYLTSQYYEMKERLGSLIKSFSFYGGVSVFIAVSIIYVFGVLSASPVYLGLGTAPAFFTLAYILVFQPKHKKIYVLLVLALFVLGGKRGYMLSAFAMLAAYAIAQIDFSFVRFLKISLVTTVIISVLSAFVLLGANNYLPQQLSKRFDVVNHEKSSVLDVRKLTSGRNLEIAAVLNVWIEDPYSSLLGLGLGAAFVNEAGNKDSTVHVSPVAMAFIFGIPLAVLFLCVVWFMPLVCLIYFRKLDKSARFWCLTSIGYLVSTLSVFTFLQSAGLWVSLGCLSAHFHKLCIVGRK